MIRLGVHFELLFTYDLPSNNAEVIGNLRALREMGALSMESLLEQSPMTTDVGQEIVRIQNEKGNEIVSEVKQDDEEHYREA
ncbi:phage portal protein [Chryseomicrobium aureum]|uniref:phage portal protein n=1 Tax=Chryseomicrobium aureum TaxID=1441723 RepID=UPI00370D920E